MWVRCNIILQGEALSVMVNTATVSRVTPADTGKSKIVFTDGVTFNTEHSVDWWDAKVNNKFERPGLMGELNKLNGA